MTLHESRRVNIFYQENLISLKVNDTQPFYACDSRSES